MLTTSCRLSQDGLEPLCAALDGIVPDGMPGHMHVELLLRVLAEALQSHGVLRRLLAVQQLDAHDVEGAYQARACPLACAALPQWLVRCRELTFLRGCSVTRPTARLWARSLLPMLTMALACRMTPRCARAPQCAPCRAAARWQCCATF